MIRLLTLSFAVLAALLLAQSSAPSVSALPSGIVAAYSFNENAGATANDISGLNNHGAVSGAAWTAAGKYGAALSFDGVNDIVVVNDAPSLDLTTGMTISAWVRPTSGSGWKTAVMKERPGHLSYALYSRTGNGRPGGEIFTSASKEAIGTANLATNTWSYLTTTYDGSRLKLYVNGNQVRSVNISGSMVISGSALVIGGNRIWSNEFFAGQIDEVRVYNRALSPAEITSDMNTPLAADATAPTVSLTAPAGGSTVSGAVTVSATASDNTGVAGVQFLLDGVALGAEDTSAPYSISWNTATVANGSHVLTARARDAAGNQTTSATVTVTVSNTDTTPPTVTASAPPSPLSGNVTLTATASDNAGVIGVQFLVDGQAVGAEDTTSPYSVSWNTSTGTNGTHAVTARARDAAGNQTTSAAVNVTVMNDLAAPAVSITAPLPNASVSGQVAIAATATDDVGVVGVQFKLDGANLGAEDSAAPYAATWNATTATGSHVLTAVARDASGKATTSAPITVTVANPNGADQIGAWTPVIDWPLVAVHTILLPNGNILMWDAWEYGVTHARVYNPATGQFTPVDVDSQIFCAAHSYLPDGRILVTGGHDGGGTGIVDASIFDPATNVWSRIADMEVPRWYPTSATLRDGRVVVIGGEISAGLFADYAEVYSPYTNSWTTLSANTGSLHDSEYPLAFLLPDNRVFALSLSYGTVHILDIDNDTWTDLPSVHRAGAAASYRAGQILYTGGGCRDCASVPTSMVIDFNQASPSWRTIEPMHFGRFNHNLVTMPDGKIMAVGGATIVANTALEGVLTPEIFDPAMETWQSVAPQAQPRLYHSTAMLLPDGRILSAGGGRWSVSIDYPAAEFYSPAYLFKGPRPSISSAPASAGHGTSITVTTPNAADIASVSLVSLPSVTHTIDMNQHFVPLTFTKNAGSLTVNIPANAAEAPPVPYMLFILNSQGVPSVASMISLTANSESTPPSVAVTKPAAASTVSGTTVRIEANATDASGIATVEFFAGGNSIGKATSTNPYAVTWNSTTVPNGNVVLTAKATDVYGNTTTSAPVTVTVSNQAAPPVQGLVMALGFNENGGSVASDSSGTNNHGGISGSTWTPVGKYGAALSFDGLNDWVTVADSTSLDLTTGMTVSAWVRPTTLGSGWRTVLMKERPGHLAYSLYGHAGNRPSAEIFTSSSYVAYGSGILPIGVWSHLAMTYDGATLRFYLNGSLVSSSTASSSITISGSPLRIGGNATWGDEFFDGLIDEVRVYNRALSQAELQTDMNTPVQ